MLAAALMSALAVGLLLTASTELRIAANFSASDAASYAAESVVERAILDLSSTNGWDTVINGPTASAFVDGPAGARVLADGSTVDLSRVVNQANCQKIASCSAADMNAVTEDRPWGGNNPRWRLFAYGPLRRMQPPGGVESPFYVVAMVGDDPAENDGDPSRDGTDAANPGAGVIAIRGEAFGPNGAHAVVEVTVARIADPAGRLLPGLRRLAWRSNP